MKKLILCLAVAGMSFTFHSCRETTEEKTEDALEAIGEDIEDNTERAAEKIEEGAERAAEELDEEFHGTDDVQAEEID